MGLLSRLMGGGAANAKKATDDVLLLHGMLLMAGADGTIEQSELSTVQAFFDTLPEFKDKSFDELLSQANRVVAKHGGLKQSINALGEIQSPAIKKKCSVLAADIAQLVAFLATSEPCFITGQHFVIDGFQWSC